MSVASQLYELQEIDLELETSEQANSQLTSQLGESEVLTNARQKLARERQHLEELKKEQRSIEWEIDDISGKLKAGEKDLYGGRITNSKELASLQHEMSGFKIRRSQLEDKELALMEQVDIATKEITKQNKEVEALEAEDGEQHQKLRAALEQVNIAKASLEKSREELVADIDPQALAVYNQLKKQKGTAVAKVEQGICRGCRISLPRGELQAARGEGLVRCNSCGRILYLA
ncbi:MAG: C4-type zinc ribbon domain-containing protein [Chloroflexota bacterium]